MDQNYRFEKKERKKERWQNNLHLEERCCEGKCLK
jgi:hypothetical protein